jgi:homopolymeric O-antigen transport system ATP-binding protein
VSVAVRCQAVSKGYLQRPSLGVKELLVGRHRRAGRFTRAQALQDVSFDVGHGRACGIVGHNGSGKSTLLALVLGVMRPDSGTVITDGRIASLLALGSGFHPELTGRENVFLYGSLLGMRLREIRALLNDIVRFSELEDAVENPIRTYSAGMVARLGFATVVHAPADILLIDEVLAVGDLEFQAKCGRKLLEFRRRGGTLVIVSHDLAAVERLCDQALWLDEGQVAACGDVRRVVAAYAASSERAAAIETTG